MLAPVVVLPVGTSALIILCYVSENVIPSPLPPPLGECLQTNGDAMITADHEPTTHHLICLPIYAHPSPVSALFEFRDTQQRLCYAVSCC